MVDAWPSEGESFDAAGAHVQRAFGVDYRRLDLPGGGELWLTRIGWEMLDHLHPDQWWTDKAFKHRGERLSGSTGTVYRVPTYVASRRQDLVVKFSRVGQHVPLMVPDTFPDEQSRLDAAEAQFLSPFEEFGRLMDLRKGWFGPSRLRIRTMRPLAIFEPPGDMPAWKSGRSPSSFHRAEHALEADQTEHPEAEPIRLDIAREYVTIFQWLKGTDAEALARQGLLTDEDLERLTRRVIDEMASKGFCVLDNKPRHFICRTDRVTGEPRRRYGRLIYGLVDFELLEQTEAYRTWLRRRYNPWHTHAVEGSD